MTSLQRYCGYWLALLAICFSLSCSQGSSRLEQDKQNPSIDSVEGAESATGIANLQKPIGELNDHLTVSLTPFQYSDANLLVDLRGDIQSQSNVPLLSAHWMQIGDGPRATILKPKNPVTPVLMPDVTEPTELMFRLYGVNNNYFTNAATTKVLVMPPADAADAKVISVAANENAGTIDFTIRLNKPANVPLSISYRTIDRTAVAEEDYLPIQGILTFPVGTTDQVVTVEIVDDNNSDDGEYFELGINGTLPGPDGDIVFGSSGLGVIKDNEPTTSFPTTPGQDVGPSDAPQTALPGAQGLVRINLQWGETSDNLNLLINDPCDQMLFVDSPSVNCLGGIGNLQSLNTEFGFENAYWPEYAAPGPYVVSVEHFQGQAANYDVRVFYGDQSQHITGTIANGDTVEVFRFDYLGGEASSSASDSSSSEAEVSSSVSVSSSSVLSSSSTNLSSSSNASSSAEEGSSSESSSDVSSGDASSSLSSSVSSSSEISSAPSSSSHSSESSSSVISSISSSSSSSSELSSSAISSTSSSSSSSGELSSSSIQSLPSSSSSSSESSSQSSSSSIANLDPSIQLNLGNQPDILGLLLPFETVVVFDPDVQLTSIYATLTINGDPQGNLALPLSLVSNGTSVSAELDLSLGDWSLSDGTYGLSLSIVDELGRTAHSATQLFNVTNRLPVSVTIDRPAAGNYYAPINIAGSIFSSPGAILTSQIRLGQFNGEGFNYIDIPLAEGDLFAYSVTEPGIYELLADVSDGVTADSASVRFAFIDPSISLTAAPQHSLNSAGQFDVTGELNILVDVLGDDSLPKQRLDLQWQDDNGNWLTAASFDFNQVWDNSTQNASLNFDFTAAQFNYDLYNFRVLLSYAAGLTEVSPEFAVDYRAYIPTQLSILEPQQESTHFQPIRVVVSVTGDSTAQITVSGSLTIPDTLVTQDVSFSTADDGTYYYDIDQPNRYEFTITADDANTPGTDSSDILYLEYVIPQIDVQLQHNHPMTVDGVIDLFEPLNLNVQVTSNINRQPAVFELLATINGSEQVLQTYDAAQIWNSQNNSANLIYDFTGQPFGTYDIRVRALLQGSEGVSGTSTLLPILWRNLDPLTIQIEQPLNGSTLPSPVDIRGTFSGDSALPIYLTATLTDLDSQNGPITLVLDNQGSDFFDFTVDTEGRYRFTIVADNSLQSTSASVDFAYQIEDLVVNLSHTNSILANGNLDITDRVFIDVSIDNPQNYSLQECILEMLIDDNWQPTLESNNCEAFYFDMRSSQLPFGTYLVRVRVDYLNTSSASLPLTLTYRAIPPTPVVDIVQPGLDVFPSITSSVDMEVNYSSLSGSVDLFVRLLNPSGQEILIVNVANDENWTINNGVLSGKLNFSQLLPLANDNYTVEVFAVYDNDTSAHDQFTLAYAEPDLPQITIDQPQPATNVYSFSVDINGSVAVDNRLGANGVTSLFGTLERLTPNPATISNQLNLNYANGRFNGVLSENQLNQSGTYRLTLFANDSLDRVSDPASVSFTYQVPLDLDVQINSPQILSGTARVDFYQPQFNIDGAIQIQTGTQVTDLTLSVLQSGQIRLAPLNILNSLAANNAFNYSFNFAQLGLTEGNYDVVIEATDSRGRRDSATLPISYRRLQTPQLTLQAQPKGDESRLGGPYTANFTVDSRINSITLNGTFNHGNETLFILEDTTRVNNGQGSVYYDIPDDAIQPGLNTLTINLDDGQNHVSTSAQINFQPPVVTVQSPQSGTSISNETLNIIFSVDFQGPEPNTNNLPNTRVFLDNVVFATAPPQRLQDGRWQLSINTNNLSVGQHQISLEVGDYRRANVVNDRVNDARARVSFIIPARIANPQVGIVMPTNNSSIPYSANNTFNIRFTHQYSDGANITQPNFSVVINGSSINGNSIIGIPAGTNSYEVNLPMSLLNKGRNTIEIRVVDYRESNFVGSSGVINVTVPNIYPPAVTIDFPSLNKVVNYTGFNLIFSTIYDNPDDQVPYQPVCNLLINNQEYNCGFGIPTNTNGFAVVLNGLENDIRRGTNTIRLTVSDYRDNSISTTVTRDFTYTPATLSLDLQNANGAILPLSDGDVRVNFSSNVPLTSAVIYLDNTRLGNPTLSSNATQAPYTYSYTIPSSAITPGWSDVTVESYMREVANGYEVFATRQTVSMSYRDPVATITSVRLINSLFLGVSVTDPGGGDPDRDGDGESGIVRIYYNNQEIGMKVYNPDTTGEPWAFSFTLNSANNLPSVARQILLVLTYEDDKTGKELYRSSKTIDYSPLI